MEVPEPLAVREEGSAGKEDPRSRERGRGREREGRDKETAS